MYKQSLKNKQSILEYKKYKNKLNDLIRISKNNYFKSKIDSSNRDIKTLWNVVKNQ